MRKKWLRWLPGLFLAAALVFPVRAAGVHMGFSDPTATVGEEVSVVVLATAEGSETALPLSRVEMTLCYDGTLLRYEDAAGGMGSLRAEEENGKIVIQDAAAGGSSVFLAELHVTALSAGEGSITVENCAVLDGDGAEAACSLGSARVSIAEKMEQDVSLYALLVNHGTLEPAFSPSCTEYSLTVPESVASITVAARPNNYWASAYVDGHAALELGENTVTVTVTSGDGSAQRVYTIAVYRGTRPTPTPEAVVVPERELPPEPTPSPSPTPTPEPTPDVEQIRRAGYEEGLAAGQAEAETARAALQTARERIGTLEHAAKLSVGAALAELLLIAVLGGALWYRYDGKRRRK